jgi:hypothetical protein
MSGKGSKPRPYSVSQEQFASCWDAIFRRGVGEQSKPADSKPARGESSDVGANPTSAANVYVDADTLE